MTRLRRLFWTWWLWAVACGWFLATDTWWLALGAGLMALVSFQLTPHGPLPQFGLEHTFDVRSPEFLHSMAGATGTPFVRGNAVDVLHNGDAFYPAMLQAIRDARVSITIEAYIYWDGEVGREFAGALAERARAGVGVHLLLDAIGSAAIGTVILSTLQDGGCRVEWYNPIHWYTLGRFNNRTHRKTLVVDGLVAFTGGAGIADHWRGDARGPREWRDDQVRVRGPAVRALQTGFAHNWRKTTGEVLSGAAFYPELPKVGTLSAQTLLGSRETGGASVQTLYYLSIVSAHQSIYIANPYFVPDPVSLDTLIDARTRGVDVRIMVAGVHNDNWLARRNTVRLFGRLLAAGVVILDYDKTMLHHKVMVVDGCWVTIGTTNFDQRSFTLNEESNLSVRDDELAAHFLEAFRHDELGCRVVTADAWKARGLWARGQEALASLFEEQV
jgi:cardiolipin synthase